jgi:hypothetical protein
LFGDYVGAVSGDPTRTWSCGATVEPVVARALLTFKTLPRSVRLLWIVAAFVGLNVLVRFVA